jgi:hypothetical protein
MDNVEIKKSNLEAAYKQADDNTKKLLATLFGDAVTTKDDRPVTERIKTFEDAMAALGSNHPFVCDFRAFCAQSDDISSDDISPDMLAYLKLRIICAALNEGWKPQFIENEYRWYPWFFLWTSEELYEKSEKWKQERHLISTGDFHTGYDGIAYAYSYYVPSITHSTTGSRLCLKNEALAEYCGKQFIELWADFSLIRK